jgi:hypothetical protein
MAQIIGGGGFEMPEPKTAEEWKRVDEDDDIVQDVKQQLHDLINSKGELIILIINDGAQGNIDLHTTKKEKKKKLVYERTCKIDLLMWHQKKS